MATHRVTLTTHANTTVEIDAPDNATDEEIAELAMAACEDNAPTLCRQCVGGDHGAQHLDLGDDWTVATHGGRPAIARI
ncbi:hypothetical protein [Kitasatospora cineracea]|uniref:Uncharacterized protein n=1 Tax=Kitasatospora cineracea TaxID=88074 RepID=A0A3N4RJH4_9ACTN|nr:hypothetical protein [Kitasatospora cineracea]RPE27210.1 hypothetical protein EDD38_7354 [Kitasatospora cineracea]RPE27340.1 hypothetical protein EDD38_7485 [Kitasatospora cineracea]